MSASRVLFLATGSAPCKRCGSLQLTSLSPPLHRRSRHALPTSHPRSYSSFKRPDKPWHSGSMRNVTEHASTSVSGPAAAAAAAAVSATPIPKSIVAYLDEYVIGQDDAKRALAVGVFNHYIRAAFNENMSELDHRRSYLFPKMNTKKVRAKKQTGKFKNAEEEESILSDFVGQTKGSRRWSDDESSQSTSLSPTYFSSQRPVPADVQAEMNANTANGLTSKAAKLSVDTPLASLRNSSTDTSFRQLDKSNMILIGPSGSGKTHLIRTLSASLSVPFVHVDATPLTSAGYVGEDVESIMSRLLEAANWNVEEAERGIVCIDEVDKLASPVSSSSAGSLKTAGRDVGGTGVQQALLRILEGSVVSIADKRNAGASSGGNGAARYSGKSGNAQSKPWWSPEMQQLNAEQQGKYPQPARSGGSNTTAEAALVEEKKRSSVTSASDGAGTVKIDTSKVLFVLCGAFVGLEDIIAARGASSLDQVEAEDLTMYGLIPEFVGRLPVMVTLKDLTEKELERILTEPRNALVPQYQTLFASYDVKLHFTTPAIASLAHQAAQSSSASSGARMLRRLMEKRLLDAMYDGPGGGARYALMDQSAAQGLSQVQLFSRGGRSAWLNAIEEDEEKHRRSVGKKSVNPSKEGEKLTSSSSSQNTSLSPLANSNTKKIQMRSNTPSSSLLLARIDEATLRRRARARLTRASRVGNLRILTSEG